MYAPGMPFNGSWLEQELSLGGSESAALFMARALAKLEHQVTVYTDCSVELECDGVAYRFAGAKTDAAPLGTAWNAAVLQEHDVCIVQRVPIPFTGRERAGLRLWWLHDLALLRQRPLVDLSLPFVDRILCVSEFHRQQAAKIWEINPAYIIATANGVDYDLVHSAIKDIERKPKQLVFASRPERGLTELLQPGGIMESLPDYTLYLCTYANIAPQMRTFYQALLQRAATMPNVINHGHLGKHALYRLLAQSKAYVYPTAFEDTSNIMLLEANACGTPFIAPENLAALPETGREGALVEVPWPDGTIDSTVFAQNIRKICENDALWHNLSTCAQSKRQSWDTIALDWQRHINQLLTAKPAERQSLSLCMIVKNAADTLAQAVKSAADLCDEVIIGVDDTTDDETMTVARQLGASVIPIASPLITGFDAARNAIMEHVKHDWLLWLDSDEVLDKPWCLAKYLQDSPIEAFALPQHHLAAEPAGLLKTDYPARLFRNGKGFRFFGLVHEHPEKGLNGGLGRAVKITDTAIMHQGYPNENIRRRRFARNWPLLQRDRVRYPQRPLGQMLWLRDLTHLMRYQLEQQQKPIGLAQQIVRFWQETFVPKASLQLMLEALPYYSEAVRYLHGQNAVEIKLSLLTGKAFVSNNAAQNVHGYFADVSAAHTFLKHVFDNSLNDFDDKYF